MTTAAFEAADAPPRISLTERALLARVLAVVTGKGGILKTATITALADALARMGFVILVVDVDSHAIASRRDLGLHETEHDDKGKSLADALMVTFMTGTPTAPTVVKGVRSYPNGGRVDVIVGGTALEAAIDGMSAVSVLQKRPYTHVLGQVIATVSGDYHMTLVDNDPKIKTVRLMVLEAAAFSYAPMDYDIAAYEDGLNILIKEIGEARERNPEHVFLGAVAGRIPDPTIRAWRRTDGNGNARPGGAMVDIAKKIQVILDNEVFDSERALLPGYPKLFNAMIHYSALNVAKAREKGVTIGEYLRSTSLGTTDEELLEEHAILRDYDEFARETLAGMNAAIAARNTA